MDGRRGPWGVLSELPFGQTNPPICRSGLDPLFWGALQANVGSLGQVSGMGFTSSLYNTVLSMGWAEEVIRGNPRDRTLPFHWDSVELNLPGNLRYAPLRPWVSKRRCDGSMAAEFLTYCDDLRICGPAGDWRCWPCEGSQQCAITWGYRTRQGKGVSRSVYQVPRRAPWLSPLPMGSMELSRWKDGIKPRPSSCGSRAY
jgi:hypothetical protein